MIMAKPFSPRELEYRVEAASSRAEVKNGDDRLEIGDLVVTASMKYREPAPGSI
jgi:DNA-binding response OmpR family regulator